jgi:hypothetical protein
MARQSGILKIEGTIGGITFYKTKDGYLSRRKGGVPRERILTDPVFTRTRENGKEFGEAAKSGKLLRAALRPITLQASDDRVTPRLTQVMHRVMCMDSISERGSRNVATALTNRTARALLNHFNFNIDAEAGSVLNKPVVVHPLSGRITIDGLVPQKDIAFPDGATEVSISSAWAIVDFATRQYETRLSNVVTLPLDLTSTNVLLTPSEVPTGAGVSFFVLKIGFFQSVNGRSYGLANGAYHCVSVVGVEV